MRNLKPIVAAMVVAFAASACQISPVITDPDGRGGNDSRYGDCRRASRDICKIRESDSDSRKTCMAEATYECLKGGGE